MISEQHKCLFVHVPKTGGQSVELYFLNLLGLRWARRKVLLLRRNNEHDKGPPRLAHLTATEYVSCGYLSEEQFREYYKFAFVRNPWARLVSEYRYREFGDTLTFKDWLFRKFPKPGWSDRYRHVIPQHEFLYTPEGERQVDFVGKFEFFQQDFTKVCEKLGFTDSALPHRNKSAASGTSSRSASYQSYFDDESRQFVAEKYARDIELFDYAFEAEPQPDPAAA